MDFLSGLINTAANVWQSNANRNMQYDLFENQLNYGTREAQKQRDWEESMYKRYHTPEAQLKQIKAAGLSPALLYAQGLGSGAGVFHGGAPNTPGAGVPQTFGGGMGGGIAEAAEARKLNAEAEVIEQYGGKRAEADLGLINANEALAKSQEVLNNALKNKTEEQARWQSYMADIAEIETQIKSATKEDAINLVGAELDQMIAAKEWYDQQIRESKNKITNRDKLTEEQAKWYHAQTFVAFSQAYEKSLGNQITEEQKDALIKITQETARKVAAEASNEEDFVRRFEAEMEQRIRDNKTTLEAASIIAASNVIGGIGRMLGSGGMKRAKAMQGMGNMGRFTRTTTQKIGNKTIKETREWPVQYGGYGTYGGYGKF